MKEAFKSKAQQRYFFWKANNSTGKDAQKWKDMADEFADKTKNFKKLPDKLTEMNEKRLTDAEIRKIASDFYHENENKIKAFWGYPDDGKLVIVILKPSKISSTSELSSKLSSLKYKHNIDIDFKIKNITEENDKLQQVRDKIQSIYRQFKDKVKSFWIYPTKDEIKIVKFEIEDEYKGKGIGAQFIAKLKIVARDYEKEIKGTIKEQSFYNLDSLRSLTKKLHREQQATATTRTGNQMQQYVEQTKKSLRDKVIARLNQYKQQQGFDKNAFIKNFPNEFREMATREFSLKGKVVTNINHNLKVQQGKPNTSIIVTGYLNPTLLLDLKLDLIVDFENVLQYVNLYSRIRQMQTQS